MSRYIDADTLIATLKRLYEDEWNRNVCTSYANGFIHCEELVENQPTADVRENVRGEWIREQNCFYRCSICKAHYPSIQDNMTYNYCPNCGADMRKGECDGM